MDIKRILGIWKVRAIRLVIKTKNVTFPGLGQLSLYDVGSFFVKSLLGGSYGIRSAAIAFNFFLALFPAILFLFTLIPYIPIPNFQTEFIALLKQFLPSYTFESIEATIVDIAMNPRSGLLSIGFISTIIVVSNGITSMIKAFNASINATETRSFINLRVSSLIMLFVVTALLSVAIAVMMFGKVIIAALASRHIINGLLSTILLHVVQWVVVLALCLISVSTLYYFAPAKHTRMRFLSAGSVLATVFLLAASAGFGFYLSNFSNYNALYGSIGTLIAVLVLLHLYSNILLTGFELNLSIRAARDKHDGLFQFKLPLNFNIINWNKKNNKNNNDIKNRK